MDRWPLEHVGSETIERSGHQLLRRGGGVVHLVEDRDCDEGRAFARIERLIDVVFDQRSLAVADVVDHGDVSALLLTCDRRVQRGLDRLSAGSRG